MLVKSYVLLFSFIFSSFASWDSLWYEELELNTLEAPLYLNDFSDIGGVKMKALNTGYGPLLYDDSSIAHLHDLGFSYFNGTWAVNFFSAYYNGTLGQWYAFDGEGNVVGLAYQGLIGGCSLDGSFDPVAWDMNSPKKGRLGGGEIWCAVEAGLIMVFTTSGVVPAGYEAAGTPYSAFTTAEGYVWENRVHKGTDWNDPENRYTYTTTTPASILVYYDLEGNLQTFIRENEMTSSGYDQFSFSATIVEYNTTGAPYVTVMEIEKTLRVPISPGVAGKRATESAKPAPKQLSTYRNIKDIPKRYFDGSPKRFTLGDLY